MITEASGLREVALEICTALDAIGVVAVLVGGGAATVYSDGAYMSHDVDFVIEMHADGAGSAKVMEDLGYSLNGNIYVHALSPFTVEFPPGPLAIGEKIISHWETIRDGSKLLYIISATDSCKDRLASFLYWNDLSGVEQALCVVRAQEVNIAEIRAWCESEGQLEKFIRFEKRLNS